MKPIILWVFSLLGAVLLWTPPTLATPYEYSDAPGYGTARHITGEWQTLGELWDSEESAPADDASDDGVTWSNDGGTTWHNGPVRVGQEVKFRFLVNRVGYGEHDYDQLDVWVDWNGDQVFNDDAAPGTPGTTEYLLTQPWEKGDTQINKETYFAYIEENGVVPNPDAVLSMYFESATVTIPDEVSTLWLRARVTCDISFENHPDMRVTPYNRLRQGEVEDWGIEILPIPEPGTLLLTGFGLIGLAGFRTRMY